MQHARDARASLLLYWWYKQASAVLIRVALVTSRTFASTGALCPHSASYPSCICKVASNAIEDNIRHRSGFQHKLKSALPAHVQHGAVKALHICVRATDLGHSCDKCFS